MADPEEMRRNPAVRSTSIGVGSAANKKKIEEWKEYPAPLHATGGADRLSDEADVANLERYRPTWRLPAAQHAQRADFREDVLLSFRSDRCRNIC